MKIAIYANCHPRSGFGGTQVYLGALIHALGELTDGPEEYVLLAPAGHEDWLLPLVGLNQRIEPLFIDSPGLGRRVIRKLGRIQQGLLGRFTTFHEGGHRHARPARLHGPGSCLSVSNGFIESLGVSLIHFPYQDFVVTGLPSIFNPHDLQHLHLPQFFSPETLLWRELNYPFACRLASRVAVASQWVAADLCSRYGLAPERVTVIPWGAPSATQAMPTEAAVNLLRAKHQLPDEFLFYPAVAWPHKNHARLIERAALLAQRGRPIPLMFSGAKTGLTSALEKQVQDLGLGGRVRFLGLLPAEDMRSVYRAATAVVVPTLFEATCGPVPEAWQEGIPAACSDLPQAREQADGAALFFNPHSTESITEAMLRITTDHELRQQLVVAGNARIAQLSWRSTALAYRDLYREVASLRGTSPEQREAWRL